MRGRIELLLAGLAAGCSGGDHSLWLPAGGAASAILVFDSNAIDPIEVIAVDLPAGRAELVNVDSDRERWVYALRFDAPLATLGIPAGRLELAVRGRELPRSTEPVLRSRLGGGEAGAWGTAELPQHLRDVRLLEETPCVVFASRATRLPGTVGLGTPVFASIDGESALLGLGSGAFYRVTAAGAEPLPAVQTATVPSAVVFDHTSGELWLADRRGGIYRGTLDGGLRAEAPLVDPPERRVVQLAGGRGPGGFELYATTEEPLAFFRFDGDRWTLLRDDQRSFPDRSRITAAWVDAGVAIASGWGNELLVVSDTAGTRDERLILPPQFGQPDAVYDVENVEGRGTMLGTRYGLLFAREGSSWLMYPTPPGNARVYRILPYRGGIFFGGQDGVFTQHYDETGYCEPASFAGFHVDRIVPMGDGFLIAESGNQTGDDVLLIWLEPR